MNKFIDLCNNVDSWPTILYDLGYRIKLVVQKISMETDSVTPDIVVMSNTLSHSVVVDCKNGRSIDRDQDDRHKGIKPCAFLHGLAPENNPASNSLHVMP